MSGRDDPSKPKPPRLNPFTARTKAMGSSGWEAYTVGFTLVGCIVACAGLGWFLDNRFGTSYWLPILFLVGVVAGFREMFIVVKRVERDQKRKQLEAQNLVQRAVEPSSTKETVVEKSPEERKRIFQVPPPPQPGETLAPLPRNEESVEDLIERLSRDSDEEERETNK